MAEQLSLDKATFFQYPKTKQELVRDRMLRQHMGGDLVEMILATPETVILTDQPLVPYHERPKYGYRHAQNFLKRGEEVYVTAPRTVREALHAAVGPGRRRLRAFEHVTGDGRNCGYVWRSIRDHTRRKVHLVDCLEGSKIFSYSHQSARPEDKIKITPYVHVRNVSDVGGAYDCRVLSRSRDLHYSFILHSVPLLGTKEQHYVWTHLHSSGHGGGIVGKDLDTRCGVKTYDRLTFRSVVGQHIFCPHEIAAYFAISEHAGKDRQTGQIMLQPFALPTPATVEFYKKCRTQVLLHETKKSKTTGKEYKRSRPLNEAEIEVLLWRFTAKLGYVDTWFASESKHGQRLRDYRWN